MKRKNFFGRLSGMKLRYKMLLIYVIGGALPVLAIGIYLVSGMSRILIEQAKSAEAVEMEMTRRQVEEITGTVSTVTNYFYFDSKLEEIAAKNYTDYQELVRDYRDFTSFLDYGRYYNGTIAWINIYVKNNSIVGNSRFVPVTDEMEREEWYRAADEKNGGAIWRFRRIPATDSSALTMLRMLKTNKRENVGVLAVYIRPERFEALLQGRTPNTLVILNGETVVAGQGEKIDFGQLGEFLPESGRGQTQQNIMLDGREYVMTCETIPLAESQDYLQIVSLRKYQDILRDVNGQMANSMALFIASAVLSVMVILVFSHSFSRRVERFREQMQKAASGSFELEEKLGGSDEISDLYDYLGTMIFQIQKLLAEIYQERLRAERLAVRQKDAEFKMLASQINPHFLYNTLETIRMRARRSRQHDIEEIVKMLAKIMRSRLQAGVSEVSIKEETELVENYLRIQQYRFEDRIQYCISTEEGLGELPILPLIMQPIVENSIVHGLECKEGVGTICIRTFKTADNVVIAIEDDGMGMSREKLEKLRGRLNSYDEKGRHIGISNVHQRVRLKYGNAYGVLIDSAEGQYTRIRIFLPSAGELGGQSMYKVMIIDDESMIRWGVRDLLDWGKEGFTFCEDGKDGKDGLKKLLEHRPDLALVDIKMPGMNGIELIGAAREAGYAGSFVILTGYSEFEFAQSAIKLGVCEYLLKPIDEEELGGCVHRIREELTRRDEERTYHLANESIARQELLRRILLQMGTREEIEEETKRCGISLEADILCAAILTDRELPVSREEGEFQEKTRFFLQDETLCREKMIMDGQVVLVSSGVDYKSWIRRLEERNEHVRRRFGRGLLIAVGHNVSQWHDLYYSYEFARFMLEQEFLFRQYDVLSISTVEQQQKNVECPSPEQISMLIEVGDLKGIGECVDKFRKYCRKSLMSEMDIKIRILYSLMVIRGSLEKKYGKMDGKISERMEELNRSEELNQLTELYSGILRDMCGQIGNDDSGTAIKRMYYYMEKNYDQDLKVESFARMFGYNANYLGKIFRKEMGDSFNNILDSIRIANAKRLLAETDMKVYQISEQVGYGNIDYFYLKFKKYVGISPKEYRKEMAGTAME